MQSLQTLIDLLCRRQKIHISILDVKGMLHTPLTRISAENVIHSKPFCQAAKATKKGGRVCLRCKMLANTKAISQKHAFSGHCFWGIFEAAYPVLVNENVGAVVYVGNAITDKEKSAARIRKAANLAGVSEEKLLRALEECEHLNNPKILSEIAEIVGDYLKSAYEISPKKGSDLHWLVQELKQHAQDSISVNISLRTLARLYGRNEKYIGRLFKKEMGISFHEYCNQFRLKRAETMLKRTSGKILDIALESGFNNISYFNRIFQEKHGMTPSEYRKKNTE